MVRLSLLDALRTLTAFAVVFLEPYFALKILSRRFAILSR